MSTDSVPVFNTSSITDPLNVTTGETAIMPTDSVPVFNTLSVTDPINVTTAGKPDNEYHLHAWIMVLLVVSILGNSSVIAAFFRDARLRVIFNLFVVHLATADLMMSCIVIVALADEMTQVSLIGRWTAICQVCTVFANALPVEQLILAHLMSNDRHWALQRGISYAKSTFHWHVEKLVLFLTWVISFVGSFLITDLMSTTKLYGQGSCKFPSRLLYITYTSFLHFVMLISLAAAVVYIIIEFRRRRHKSPQFERLQVEPEGDINFGLSCRPYSTTMESRHALIPRSPLSRDFSRLLGPKTQEQAFISQSLLSPNQLLHREILRTQPKHLSQPQSEALQDSSPPTRMSPTSPSCHLLGIHNCECHFKAGEVVVKEDLTKQDNQCKHTHQTYENNYVKYKIAHNKFKLEQPVSMSSEFCVKTEIQKNGPAYETSNKLDLVKNQGISTKQHFRVSWPESVDNRDQSLPKKRKFSEANSDVLVNKGIHEIYKNIHINNECVQSGQEKNKEAAFNESAEDLLPASFSLSDDELADIQLPRLRPRTDSLYTLRSCLSISEESLTKTTEESRDVSIQSEGFVSNGTSGISLKTQRGKRNNSKLFIIGDAEEGCSEIRDGIVSVKPDSINISGTNIPQGSSQPIEHLQHSGNESDIHCEPSACYDLILIDAKDSSFRKEQKIISNSKEDEVNKNQQKSTKELEMASTTSKLSEECHSSTIQNRDKLTDCGSFANNDVFANFNVEPQLQDRPTAENDSQESNRLNQNNTNLIIISKNDYFDKPKDLQISNEIEMRFEENQECPDINYSNFSNGNNSAGNSRTGDGLSLSNSDLQCENTAITLTHDASFHIVAQNTDPPEVTEELKLPEIIKTPGTLHSVSFTTVTTNNGQQMSSAVADSTKCHAGNFENKPDTNIGNNAHYTFPKQLKKHSDSATSISNDTRYYFDAINTDSSEYSFESHKHSQKDIENAVDNWIKFYEINLTSPYKDHEFELFSTSQCFENLQPWYEHGRLLSQPGQSVPCCQTHERARQMWLDFYGIDMPEKATQNVKHELNRHLISVPVDVHNVEAQTLDDCATSEPAKQQTHSKCNNIQFSPFIDAIKSDVNDHEETKTTKRVKRVIKFKRMEKQSHSLYEYNRKLSSTVYPLEFECTQKDFDQSIMSKTEQQYRTTRESYQNYSTSEANESNPRFDCRTMWSKDTVKNDSCFSVKPMSTTVDKQYTTIQTSYSSPKITKETINGSKQNSTDNDVKGTEENLILCPSTVLESNLISTKSFSSEQCIKRFEKSNTLGSSRSQQTWANAPNLSDTYLVNDSDIHIEDPQMKIKNDSLSKRKETIAANAAFTENIAANTAKDAAKTADIAAHTAKIATHTAKDAAHTAKIATHTAKDAAHKTNDSVHTAGDAVLTANDAAHRTHDAVHTENDAVNTENYTVCTVNKDQLKDFEVKQEEIVQTCTHSKENKDQIELFVDIADIPNQNAADNKKENHILQSTILVGKKQDQANNHYILSKPTNCFMLENHAPKLQTVDICDIKENVTEATYKILESMSITCRAFLVELGIYRDILTGIIPLDKEKLLQSELRDISPCPDCERRERKKMQKLSSLKVNSSTISDEAPGCSPEDAGKGNITMNSNICRAQSSQKTKDDFADIHFSVDNVVSEVSPEKSQNSSLKIKEFHKMDLEAGLSRSESLASTEKNKDYHFMRLPRRVPNLALLAIKKFSFEELKAKDPELCILMSLICIVLLQLICWLPITIMYMVFDVTGYPLKPRRIELIFLCFWCFRMAFQPFLYACYSKYFRENYVQLLCCQWRR